MSRWARRLLSALLHAHAAVDRQSDAGDEARIVRAQKHCGVADIADLGEPAERRLFHHRADCGVDVGREPYLHDVAGELHAHVGRYQAGIDAIAPTTEATLS